MKSYTTFQSFLTVFLLFLFNLGGTAQIQTLYEGDICRKGDGETSDHICRTLEKCPVAIKEIEKQNHPQICSFDGKTPIVCCPPEVLKSYSATEKCREYSELIYFKRKDPILTASINKENYIINIDCYESNPLISGGEDAEPKEFPHMALLGFGETPDNQSWACGGSLISNRFILTAAHCEKMERNYKYLFANWARLGELDYNSVTDDARPVDYKIVQHIIHPNYKSPSLYHDIALFRLERDVDFSAYIRPICLNTDNKFTPPAIMATGWGKSGMARKVSPHLLKVQLNTISAEVCDSSFSSMPNKNNKLAKGIVENSMLCTGNTEGLKDTCGGDSGGPILIKHNTYKCMYSQIGITSFGQGMCGRPDASASHTRVSNYISWIERIVWPKM